MAQRTDFSAMACSLARTWAVIGEPWTPLVLRDLALGIKRFDVLRVDLGVAANVLTSRLNTLVEAGMVERVPYKDAGRTRHEYELTEMGAELVPVLMAITNWGDKWVSDNVPPAVFDHAACGRTDVEASIVCSKCGEPLLAADLSARPGPGNRRGPGSHLIATAGPEG